jgi:hypothetical protein
MDEAVKDFVEICEVLQRKNQMFKTACQRVAQEMSFRDWRVDVSTFIAGKVDSKRDGGGVRND